MATTARRQGPDSGWFTSSFSNNGNQCVEVRITDEQVYVRDSKFQATPETPHPTIAVPTTLWTTFLHCLLLGSPHPTVSAHVTPDGSATLRHAGTTLEFTAEEWTAFVAGVRENEFAVVG
ncbi:DUF397 domain-containing protein [Nocardia camponoti]|uniref:DUF397 domain-containing protein n=1 Tax=Nocardia camponoti TaxID=1616106 RepID=A0A917V9N6_9NOCA|nr:DUF397 domain-containing protein [Nocardia camponoti]GGK54431.1 hypothetical protein GCM10011591_27800 [Nocardia camponoti]